MALSAVLGDLEVVLFEDGCHHAEGGQRENVRGLHVKFGAGRGCPCQRMLLPMVGDADEDSVKARGLPHFGPHMEGVHVQ